MIGAAIATGPVLIFGFIAQRYLGDFVPVMVLLGIVGLYVVVAWCQRVAIRTRIAASVAFALVALIAIWFGVGLAVLYQQVSVNDSSGLRAFVRNQFAGQRVFPGGAPDLTVASHLPERAPLGTVVVVGDCGGVFISNGFAWRALERTPATGGYRLRATFPDAAVAGGVRSLRCCAPDRAARR